MENGYNDKYLDQVKSIKPGDRVAIKAAYTKDHVINVGASKSR